MGGFIVLVLFILYGFVYPIYTRLGCTCFGHCEKCVPDKDEQRITDHVIDEPPELVVSEDLVNAIIARADTMRIQGVRKGTGLGGLRNRFNSKASPNSQGVTTPLIDPPLM